MIVPLKHIKTPSVLGIFPLGSCQKKIEDPTVLFQVTHHVQQPFGAVLHHGQRLFDAQGDLRVIQQAAAQSGDAMQGRL
jgi:hypothetical protein